MDNNDLDGAIPVLHKAIELDPKNAQSCRLLGVVLLRKGQFLPGTRAMATLS